MIHTTVTCQINMMRKTGYGEMNSDYDAVLPGVASPADRQYLDVL